MPALKRISTPELKGIYANSNRFTIPPGTIPRMSNLYMIRRGALHTVPGSKWISSYDNLAPHSTTQQPIKSLNWYSPSIGSGPDLYMGLNAIITAHNFVMALQLAGGGASANLIDVSSGMFTNLAGPVAVTQPSTAHGYQINATQFSDYFVTALGNSTPPQIFPVVTLLNGAINNSVTTIATITTAAFPNSGFFQIDNEAIQYTGKTATSFTGCTRGALGTGAASHLNLGEVLFGINNAGAFLAQPWNKLGNQFIATNIYPPWPGIHGTMSVAVNVGTLITVFDGNNVYWVWKAQNSGFTGQGSDYWGPQFWPGGVYGGGNMTAGSNVLTAVGNAPFLSGMVGLPVTVAGAGSGGGPLTGLTVSGFTDTSHVQLSGNAVTTVTNAIYSIGAGNYNDTAQDHNPTNNSGTITWINLGQASLPPPGAAFVFQHLNYLFLWGVGQTYGSDGITGPDALWQSDAGQPCSFNAANVTFAGKGDGTEAMGGAVYSLSEAGIAATPQLVLFKGASTYSFLNAFPNASLVQVSGGLGCIAPATIQFIGGYGVMRLTYLGFALFDGQLEHVTEYTDAIQGYIFGGLSDVVAIDFTNIGNAVSAQSKNPPMYVAFLPLTGGSGYATRAFAYDFALKQWTVMDFPFAIGAAAYMPEAVVGQATNVTTLIGGSVDGVVRQIFAGDSDWDGTPITWSTQLPDFGFPGSPVYARRLNPRITADGGGATPKLTAVSFSGIRRSGRSFIRALNKPLSILGSMDIGEVVLSGAVTVTGQGQVLIEGSDLYTSEKPLGRVGL